MRIAFVSWRDLAHPQAGGSELVVDRLAGGLAARGHEVALMCGGPVAPHGYPVVDLGGTYGQYLRAPLVHRRRFRHWDLLVDVENGVPYFSPLWRRRPSVCLVHHVHTDQWAMRFGRVVAAAGRFVERRVMPRLYRHRLFVAVSPSTATALEALGVDEGRIRIVQWGVEAPGPARPEAPEPQFLALGRLVPHKQVDLMLRAWERVRPSTGGTLVIVGDGPERARLEATAPAGTVFAGRVDEVAKARLLARSWFLVHTAAHEGWGVVVMEAAAAGRPTLALDAPGVRDAVIDGTTGILAHDEDDLVERWVALAGDSPRRATLAGAAAGRAAACSWDRTVDDFEAIAAEAAGGAVPAPAERRAA